MSSVLLVEDDENVAAAVTLGLQRLGHDVHRLDRGTPELEKLAISSDVVVLDIGLPGMDGFALCRRIRAASEVPVIMLTARSEDIDQVAGLEAGGDDYVVKPVSPRVLDARIKAVIRRTRPRDGGADELGSPVYRESTAQVDAAGAARSGSGASMGAGSDAARRLVIDHDGLRVLKNDSEIALTPTEMRLLLALDRNEGVVLSRDQLLEIAWNHDYLGNSRLVDATVGRLRSKIEEDPNRPRHLHTVRGFGYRFNRTPNDGQ